MTDATHLREDFEALMPEPIPAMMPNGDRYGYTADQMRTAMQAVWNAATERANECTTCGALVVGVAQPFDGKEAKKRGIEYFADRFPALREALEATNAAAVRGKK